MPEVVQVTFDHELVLIGQDYIQDEIGNWKKVPVRTTVLCGTKSVTRGEFYSAAQTGLRLSIVFVVHSYEYNGEAEVEFEGEKYKVIRTYAASFEEMELTCEKVIANGHSQD
jgi:SPP1 family predicted phage head-tail adaptor